MVIESEDISLIDSITFLSAFQSLFVCSGLTSLSTLSVILRRCLVVTGSSMLTFIVLPHCGIRSQTLLPDTTSSHIILTPERPVLALPRKSEWGATSTIVNDFGGSNPVPPDLDFSLWWHFSFSVIFCLRKALQSL